MAAKHVVDGRGALYAALRLDIGAFMQKAFEEVCPGAEFMPNWHLDAMAHNLEQVVSGNCTRLIINVPPRSLKSICVSVVAVAWALGHDPTLKFMCVSYSQDLADEFGRQCLKIMRSDWYQRTFPGTRISAEKRAPNHFMTTRGGSRFATSIEGPATGRGADVIIIDDPLKAGDADSKVERTKVNKWFDGTMTTRLDNKNSGRIVLVMQRLHIDDLTSHLLEKEDWTHLCLPAIAPHDMEIDLVYGRRHLFKAGQALHPERESLASLAKSRRAMGEYHFSAQYLQSPIPRDGAMVRQNWFRVFDQEPAKESGDEIVISWDTASKAAELNSYSVGTVWLIRKMPLGKHYYLLDVVREKLEFPELRRRVIALRDRWRPSSVLIEDKASGQALIQDLRREGFPVTPIQVQGDKVVRFSGQTPVIEQGRVFLPAEAPWLAKFREELMLFPHGKHADQVDSVSQFLNWAENRTANTCYVQSLW